MSQIQLKAQLKQGSFILDTELAIPSQGVTVILGPSGSGKTTLLRILAGLEKPQQGSIRIDDALWFDSQQKAYVPAQKRNIGMVFQDYALFEHLTVEANVGFGLNTKARKQQVSLWLERLHISELAQRYPQQLSGGQRQRVALARALITEPDLLLLDEPFSALDTYLRQHLREQLLEVVEQFKQPVLMVTHDLNEARYLADHIGVMINGRIQCIEKADRVFNYPPNLEVARVLGWRNLLPVSEIQDHQLCAKWGRLQFSREVPIETDWLAIRAEHIRINTPLARIDAKVQRVTELEGSREMRCQLKDGSQLHLQRPFNELLPAAGSDIKLELPEQHIRLLQEGTVKTPLSTDIKQEYKTGFLRKKAG